MSFVLPSAQDTVPGARIEARVACSPAATRSQEASATYSLEALVDRDAGSSPSGSGRRRDRRPATRIDFGASHSGVIDLDGLGIAGREGTVPKEAEHGRTVVPRFGGPRLEPMAAARPQGDQGSFSRLPYALAGLFVGAFAGLALLVALDSPPTVVIERPAQEAPRAMSMTEAERTPATGEMDQRKRRQVRTVASAIAPPPTDRLHPNVEPTVGEPSSESSLDKAVPAPPKPRVASSTKKSSTKASTVAPKPAPSVSEAPQPKAAGDLSAACILDPASCDSSPTPANRPEAREASAETETLPDKPSTFQIRSALDAVRSQAKTCADLHGGAGQSIRVKLSVAGSTGRVTQASALGSQANSALGRCVADALSDARFPRFGAPSVGVVYPVRL